MRTLLVAIVLAIVAGAAAGTALAYWRLHTWAWSGPASLVDSGAEPQARMPVPQLEIDATDYDFGTLSLDATGRREFVFRNTGTASLQLSPGETSCKCALSEIENINVPPGEETRVTLTWRGESTVGPYRQTATILSNDPARPRVVLTVSGQMMVAVRPQPAELVLTQVAAEETTVGVFRLYGYLDEPVEVTGWQLLESATADRFEVAIEPLTEAELKEEPGARSGASIAVAVKSGLPQGAFQQTIRLETNCSTAPAIEVPIRGNVTSDIGIVGRGWNASYGVLVMDSVSRHEGAQWRLMLVVRGPHREQVRFKPVEIVPDMVQVTLGEPTPLATGAAWQTPLLIEIPKGSRTVNHMGPAIDGFGHILLETTHPKVKQLRLLLRFAIEE
jgi:hypothetical protein